MGDQLSLFGSPVVSETRRGRGAGSKPRTSGPPSDDPGWSTAPPALAQCPHHGPEHVCEFEGLDTDHSGFVHRSLCKGRIPLRMCHMCGELVSPGRWNHADWNHCLTCQPLGTLSDESRPVAEAIGKARRKRCSG